MLGAHAANATDADVAAAVDAAKQAAPGWRALSFDDRAAVFLKAADLLAGPWRATINAATMLGQSKSPYQAEIDAACELIDFWRFNVHFAAAAARPSSRTRRPASWNRMDYRPLEGFVLAITPFNFTSIAGNLPTAPALMGNVVVWKPSPTQQLAAHYTMRLLEAAGLPPGVINLVTGDGQAVSRVALTAPGPGRHPLHRVHRDVPAPVADGGREHRQATASYPRLVGRDRRQGLRHRAPVAPTRPCWPPRWSGARSSTRARSARPRPGRTCPVAVGQDRGRLRRPGRRR